MTKNTPFFFQFCRFLHLQMMYVYTLPGPEKNNYMWTFLQEWYPTSNTSGPRVYKLWMKLLKMKSWLQLLLFVCMLCVCLGWSVGEHMLVHEQVWIVSIG